MLAKIFGGFKNFSLIPVRLALGAIFIGHGGQKLFGLWGGHGLQGFAGYLEGMGLKPGMLMAILAGGAEFFGGLMILLGIYARLGAFLVSTVMAVAIWKIHWPYGLLGEGGYGFNAALLGLSFCLLFGGSGKWSLKPD